MNMEDFIEKIYSVIDEIEPGTLAPDSNYREVPHWSSMHALILIAMVKVDYGVTITGEDLMTHHTLQDIYNLILKRKI
ncbi:MAG: acyl carrier protein [Cytophagaceae bacterium]|jgi:acyl carrier protein|nr:acyl carrier protein [Cytophagaceae bacterium]